VGYREVNKVHINGFDMSYEVRGEGEALFLLHGMNGAGVNWDLVFPTPIEGFQSIIPDLRGHGCSNNPSGKFSIRQCAADVLALADELQIEWFKAIGLSLGGNTLLHIASDAINRVVAMVVVSATPYFPDQARAVTR
jgi:pimeloyl-ACP methyl ester carboxylesterase